MIINNKLKTIGDDFATLHPKICVGLFVLLGVALVFTFEGFGVAIYLLTVVAALISAFFLCQGRLNIYFLYLFGLPAILNIYLICNFFIWYKSTLNYQRTIWIFMILLGPIVFSAIIAVWILFGKILNRSALDLRVVRNLFVVSYAGILVVSLIYLLILLTGLS